MSLNDTIRTTFYTILENNGTEVTNLKTNKKFIALVTSGDFIAQFTESDQDNELSIQLSMFEEDAPQTGEKLLIGGKKYIVQTVQSRVNGPITKVTVYATRK